VSAKPSVLFANYAVPNCGVHQYGENWFAAIAPSEQIAFECVHVRDLAGLDDAASRKKWDAIIVNFHSATMTFLDVKMPRRFEAPCIALMHEMSAAEVEHMPRGIFQYYMMGDPTLRVHSDFVYSIGRVIPRYVNRQPLPAVTTVGSVGFSVGAKGYERLVDVVQEEFDDAVVRINIPANGIVDADGRRARALVESCRKRIWKPGVKLVATHEFFDQEGLLDFLAGNTVNAFLYDYMKHSGISSAADHAMAARRPFAITRCDLFRHLHDLTPHITIEDRKLKDIIAAGTTPFDALLDQWTAANMRRRAEEIVSGVLARGGRDDRGREGGARAATRGNGVNEKRNNRYTVRRVLGGVRRRIVRPIVEQSRERAIAMLYRVAGDPRPRTRFNRILDDWARAEYTDTIKSFFDLVPDVMQKKIPRANVQQAFVYETVRHFASTMRSPRILCVGSFEDSAAEALKKTGFAIEEIDPVVNQMDLNTFFQLPTTKKAAYDIVFSTSVLEHVKDDEQFVNQMSELLAPGGVGVLTCDFNDEYRLGQPVIGGDYRFYTRADLSGRLFSRLVDCELVDTPNWSCRSPDFELGGFHYTFATYTFRKRGARSNAA
jgi:hypothetical protein